MRLHTIASYASVLRPHLGADLFAPARSRLLWLPVHLAVVVLGTVAVALGRVPWWAVPGISLILGASFAGMAFVAHEALHGALWRGQRMRYFVGWLGFLPFLVSPRLWNVWHNRIHHQHANHPALDPDANPSQAQYDGSGSVRFVTDHLKLGRERFTGVIGLLIGFTGQSGGVLLTARENGHLDAKGYRRACNESVLALAIWASVLALVGPVTFLFTFVLPLVVANTIVMAFIFTNHGLSPVTETNDPLANSLTVTVPRLVGWLTLGFGNHVEHHLFPAMSSRHAGRVRAQLQRLWPERYQSMSLVRALRTLHVTGRVYRSDTVLSDPRSGLSWATLLPGTR